jgi:proline dehydrogenase
MVLQACLKRTPEDLERMMKLGARCDSARAPTRSPADLALQGPGPIRTRFAELMTGLLDRGVQPAIATHDEGLIRAAIRHTHQNAIPSDRFEFQLLYGVRRDLQRELLDRGYRVRVYIPYGENWYPYLMRRLAERPENLWFMADSVIRESPLGAFLPGRRGLAGARR